MWYALLVCPFGMPFWYALLVCPFGMPFWYALLVCPFGMPFWYALLVCLLLTDQDRRAALLTRQVRG
jgi:hypothetical protein